MSLDLSQYLDAHSKQQVKCECQDARHQKISCRVCSDALTLQEKRLTAIKVSRVKTNRGAGDESVPCLSVRQASSLGIVAFLLSNILLDVTVLCVVLGAAVSTVTMARELRTETLERRKQRESMHESSLRLRLAMRELEQAEAEFARMFPSTFQFDDLDEEQESC